MFSRPRGTVRRRTTAVARLTTLLLIAGACIVVPTQAAQAGTPSRQLKQLQAHSIPGSAGTSVAITARVKNSTGKRVAAAHVRLFLVGNQQVIALPKAKVPSIARNRHVTITAKRVAPLWAPAGRYAVRACFVAKRVDRCRTSGRTVLIAPAQLTAEAAEISFGESVQGTPTAPRQVRITNTGQSRTGALTTSVDNPAAFALSASTCGASLNPGAACTVDVRFTAATAGAAAGTLKVTGRDGGTVSTGLSGRGQTPPGLSISTASHNYGYSDVPAEHLFTVTNTGEASTGAPTTALTGGAAFSITSNTCTAALAGSATCVIGVTYAGTGSTQQSAQLELTAPGGGSVTAELTGSPVALSISPASHDFGVVDVDSTSGEEAFVLTNHRLTPVKVDEATSGAFATAASCDGTTLPAGATCAFTAEFSPSVAGAASGRITYTSGNDSAQVALQGTGESAAALSVTPAVSFGAYAVNGTPGSGRLTITNTGTKRSGTVSLSVAGNDAADFAIVSTTCPVVLAGGESCTATVEFRPASNGDKTATISVAGAPANAVALSGLGAPAGVSLVPATFDYGSVAVGGTASKTLRVVNTTDSAEAMNSASVGPPFPLGLTGDFTCVLVLPEIQPHSWCTMTVDFKPTSTGAFSTTLTAGGTNFNITAQLAGTGAAARSQRRVDARAEASGVWKLELKDGVPVSSR